MKPTGIGCRSATASTTSMATCPSSIRCTTWAFVVLSLHHGQLDYSKTITTAVMCGMDTDCTSGTAASIVGAAVGYDGLDKRWIEPFNDHVQDRGRRLRTWHDFRLGAAQYRALGKAAERKSALKGLRLSRSIQGLAEVVDALADSSSEFRFRCTSTSPSLCKGVPDCGQRRISSGSADDEHCRD